MTVSSLVVHGLDFKTARPLKVVIENGIIVEICPGNASYDQDIWIGPGLVDLQVNGFKGADLNTCPLTVDVVREVSTSLSAEGVTSYLPTVITNSNENIEEEVKAISDYMEYEEGPQNVAGIHLEGPFISPEDGPRGAHHLHYVKAPDWDLFKKWQMLARNQIKIITLSPEWPESTGFIEKCVKSGVKVAIGHTAATTEQIDKAIKAGASLSTHLGNGAHPILPRHPNYIWDQLASDELWACMIGDGFHLPPSVIKVIFRVKQGRTILVSDSVYLGGCKPGSYQTHVGGHVVLTPEGKLHLAKQPELLAGSVKSLRQGMETLIKEEVCSFEEAWAMASLHPSAFLGTPTSLGLSEGSPADLVLFKKASRSEILKVVKTIKNGQIIYDSMD